VQGGGCSGWRVCVWRGRVVQGKRVYRVEGRCVQGGGVGAYAVEGSGVQARGDVIRVDGRGV
jgi:hypothetical protein